MSEQTDQTDQANGTVVVAEDSPIFDPLLPLLADGTLTDQAGAAHYKALYEASVKAHQALLTRVKSVALEYKEEHGWCGVVDQALAEIDPSLGPDVISAKVTISIVLDFDDVDNGELEDGEVAASVIASKLHDVVSRWEDGYSPRSGVAFDVSQTVTVTPAASAIG